jgi:hypothetical protein
VVLHVCGVGIKMFKNSYCFFLSIRHFICMSLKPCKAVILSLFTNWNIDIGCLAQSYRKQLFHVPRGPSPLPTALSLTSRSGLSEDLWSLGCGASHSLLRWSSLSCNMCKIFKIFFF